MRVTALDPFINDVLLPNLGELRRRHPDLVVLAAANMRFQSLTRREADIAIRYAAPEHPDHVGRRLCRVGSALYASRDYVARRGAPRHAKDLAGHDLVGLVPEYAGATAEQWIAQHGRDARVVVRASSPVVQLEAIRLGHGVGVHACHAAERTEGVLRLSEALLLSEEYWAIVHADMARAARVRAVLDFLSERTATEAERLSGVVLPSCRRCHRTAATGSQDRGPGRVLAWFSS